MDFSISVERNGVKCPPQVSLHVIEELLDALEHFDDPDDMASDEEVDQGAVMAVGTSPVQQSTPEENNETTGYDW